MAGQSKLSMLHKSVHRAPGSGSALLRAPAQVSSSSLLIVFAVCLEQSMPHILMLLLPSL